MKNIFITGGCGYTGTVLTTELLKFGYELQDDQGSWEIKINE